MGWLGFAVLASACSDSSEASVAKSDFAEQVARALCTGIAPCCKAASIAYDSATCLSNVRAPYAMFVAGHDSSYRYDDRAAASCVGEIKRVFAECRSFDDENTGEVCQRVFVGTLKIGEPCDLDDQCVDGFCDLGTCHERKPSTVLHGKSGDSCIATCGSEGDCFVSSDGSNAPVVCFESDGLLCLAGQCVERLAIGEVCPYDGCDSNAYCDQVTTKCAARKPDGAKCAVSGQCQDSPCVEGKCEPVLATSVDACAGKL